MGGPVVLSTIVTADLTHAWAVVPNKTRHLDSLDSKQRKLSKKDLPSAVRFGWQCLFCFFAYFSSSSSSWGASMRGAASSFASSVYIRYWHGPRGRWMGCASPFDPTRPYPKILQAWCHYPMPDVCRTDPKVEGRRVPDDPLRGCVCSLPCWTVGAVVCTVDRLVHGDASFEQKG